MKKIYTQNNYLIIEFGDLKLMRPKKNIFFIKTKTDENVFSIVDTEVQIPEGLKFVNWGEFVDENDLYFPDIVSFQEFITSNTGNFNTGLPDPLNETGHVKVNYSGLTLSNFTQNVVKVFNIVAITPTISAFPVTIYPNSTPNNYSGVFDATRGTTPVVGRLIENPINGQNHIWRVQGSYNGKASGNNGSLDIIFRNPVSGFEVIKSITLPSGRTNGNFDELIITIADPASIIAPNGYILEAMTSFSDSNISVSITSITRFSLSIKY